MKKDILKTIMTDRTDESLRRYFEDVRHIGQIDAEEEVTLAIQIREGSTAALKKLVMANLRFVIKIAKEYQHKGLPLGDLINEGNLGLIKAAKRFDETTGFRFNSYSIWWIRQSIIQAFEKTVRLVRLSNAEMDDLDRLQKASQRLFEKIQREPTPEEMADASGFSIDKVGRLLCHTHRIGSIDSPISTDKKHSVLEVMENNIELPPDEPVSSEIRCIFVKSAIQKSLKRLAESDQKIILYSYGLGNMRVHDDDEISHIVGLHPLTVAKKRRGILKHLNTSRTLRTAYKEAFFI